jgi:hypothetical protein
MQEKINKMPKECQPTIPSGPDPKWRYMWRVGPRPSITRFKVVTLSLPACLYLYNFLELTYFYIKKKLYLYCEAGIYGGTSKSSFKFSL